MEIRLTFVITVEKVRRRRRGFFRRKRGQRRNKRAVSERTLHY